MSETVQSTAAPTIYKFRLNYNNEPQLKEACLRISQTRTLLVPTQRNVPLNSAVEVVIGLKEGTAEPLTIKGHCHAASKNGYLFRILSLPKSPYFNSEAATAPESSPPKPQPSETLVSGSHTSR